MFTCYCYGVGILLRYLRQNDIIQTQNLINNLRCKINILLINTFSPKLSLMKYLQEYLTIDMNIEFTITC